MQTTTPNLVVRYCHGWALGLLCICCVFVVFFSKEIGDVPLLLMKTKGCRGGEWERRGGRGGCVEIRGIKGRSPFIPFHVAADILSHAYYCIHSNSFLCKPCRSNLESNDTSIKTPTLSTNTDESLRKIGNNVIKLFNWKKKLVIYYRHLLNM